MKLNPSLIAATLLSLTIVPSALAQGLPAKLVEPAVLHPQSGAAHVTQVDDVQEPSIVGTWHVIFTAETLNGQPLAQPFELDNALTVFHPDGTDSMNSSRPAQDGSICFGLWARTGTNKYFNNHIPWRGNSPDNAPNGIGFPVGAVQITERVTLSPDGNSYSGKFKQVVYEISGQVNVTFTGTFAATRVTISTSVPDLL